MKTLNYRRIIAYGIDILIVTILSFILTYFIPTTDEYNDAFNHYISLMNDYTDGKISQKDYQKGSDNDIYVINKESIPITIVTSVLTICYFVVFNYYMNGQTLGKKILKLRIVSNDDTSLNMNNYLIRSLLANSVLMNIINIIFILVLKKGPYIVLNNITTYLSGAIYIVIFGMMLFRTDNRGLQDILAKTKVISTN